jgi:AhpD family alkylhydroperoxidase
VFDDISKIRQTRKKYNFKMFQSGVGTFRELEELESNIFREGAINQKYKELIALGISIAQSCYGWIEYHVSMAAELGATRREISEATAVALALGGGVAQWPARFVFKVMDEIRLSAEAEATEK